MLSFALRKSTPTGHDPKIDLSLLSLAQLLSSSLLNNLRFRFDSCCHTGLNWYGRTLRYGLRKRGHEILLQGSVVKLLRRDVGCLHLAMLVVLWLGVTLLLGLGRGSVVVRHDRLLVRCRYEAHVLRVASCSNHLHLVRVVDKLLLG